MNSSPECSERNSSYMLKKQGISKEDVVRYAMRNDGLRATGQYFGITFQRVSQIINEYWEKYPDTELTRLSKQRIKRNGTRFTLAQKHAMIAHLKDDHTREETAVQFNCSLSYIKRVLTMYKRHQL